jgi:hypothetical protein
MLRNAIPLNGSGVVSSQHPIFQFELRRLSWGRTAAQYWGFSVIAFGIILAVTTLLWLLFILTSPNPNSYNGSHGYRSDTFIAWLVLASFAANHVLEILSIIFTVLSVNSNYNSPHWDLIRITPITPVNVLLAKYAVAQVRMWRLMAAVVAFRLSVIVIFLAHTFFMPNTYGAGTRFTSMLETLSRNPFFESVFVLASLIAFAGIYLIDPLWHMRAFTVLGLLISTQTRSIITALGIAASRVIAMWIGQGLLTFVVPMFATVVTLWLGTFGLFTGVYVAIASLHWFYHRNQKTWLDSAQYYVFREN